jgi:hypothetical protein
MKKALLPFLAYLLPALAFAQDLTEFENLVDAIGRIVQALTPIVVALALLYFFWGLAKYILASGDEVDKAKGRDIMIWGIVALFVMVSVWGIVEILGSALSVDSVPDVDVPRVNI